MLILREILRLILEKINSVQGLLSLEGVPVKIKIDDDHTKNGRV
jgi:hypothetical protein